MVPRVPPVLLSNASKPSGANHGLEDRATASWRKPANFTALSSQRPIIPIDMRSLTPEPAATVADYCRQARRIRASFSGDSFLRHQALSDLAKRRDHHVQAGTESVETCKPNDRSNPPTPKVAVLAIQATRLKSARRRVAPQAIPFQHKPSLINSRLDPDTAEQDFIGRIAGKLHPFGFTFSDRVQLLDTAEQLGISRFRANMIMAMLEHQRGPGAAPATHAAARPAAASPMVPSLLIVLAVEIAVVAGLVWICMA
jgi:hypothetical protein